MKKEKSSIIKPVTIAALIAVLAGIGGVGIGFGGRMGIVPGGEEISLSKDQSESVTDSEQTELNESDSVEHEIRYVEITVNENGYIYKNEKSELEDIMADLNEGDVIRLKTHLASKNNVDALKEAAKEKGVNIIAED